MSSKPIVALVRPLCDVEFKFSKPFESLALGFLSAALKKSGVTPILLDAMLNNWSDTQTINYILATKPDVIGFTIVINYFPNSFIHMLKTLRGSGYSGIIAIGGHAVSFFPTRILQYVHEVDVVFSGEGESSFVNFIANYRNRLNWRNIPGISFRDGSAFINNPPLRNFNLDELEHPSRELIPELLKNEGIAAISTSRGCYARCTFCSIPRFYGLYKGKTLAVGNWHASSVDHAVKEFLTLSEDYGLREVVVVDDEFFGGTQAGFQRAKMIGERLAKAGSHIKFAISARAENIDAEVLYELKEGGLQHIFIGIEAGINKQLKLYGKGHSPEQNIRAIEIAKSVGLSFQAGMMIFSHDSTMVDILRNIQFLCDLNEFKPTLINSGVEPHFGTPLLKVLQKDKVLVDHGLSLSASYIDPKVAIAKSLAEYCLDKFSKYMNVISSLQSSITYEWRRHVPGRTAEMQLHIDEFEKEINDSFGNLIVKLFQMIIEDILLTPDETFREADRKLTDCQKFLDSKLSSLVIRFRNSKDSFRYWTQQDLINHDKDHASAT